MFTQAIRVRFTTKYVLSRALTMSESNSCPEDPGITREELNKKMIKAAGSGDHE